jgi:hypothetical protein
MDGRISVKKRRGLEARFSSGRKAGKEMRATDGRISVKPEPILRLRDRGDVSVATGNRLERDVGPAAAAEGHKRVVHLRPVVHVKH